MKKYLIRLEVELPNDFDEVDEIDLDNALSNALYDCDGQLIDSKPYELLEEE